MCPNFMTLHFRKDETIQITFTNQMNERVSRITPPHPIFNKLFYTVGLNRIKLLKVFKYIISLNFDILMWQLKTKLMC